MKITIDDDQLIENRFSRFNLITWWDQSKISKANILVIGAGALGNEILKNLALLGVKKIVVIDLDTIENSNLSRSVLFRESDIGKSKSKIAADALRAIYSEITAVPITGNVISEIGLGLFGWADVVIAGMDNREARLWINRCCWKMDKPWVDGAIEGINGVARVFVPNASPCYECTLGEADWAVLEKRMSCNMLTREEMEGGKTPTTPTTSSVIAGIQVQEAIKLLHGMSVLKGKGFIFEGLNHSSYTVDYTFNDECQSHETFSSIKNYEGKSNTTTLNDLFLFSKKFLGHELPVILEFSRDIIWKLKCHNCLVEEELFVPVGSVPYNKGPCNVCGKMREVITAHNFTGIEDYGNMTISSLGLPLFDLFNARNQNSSMQIRINGDKIELLGKLANEDSTIWEIAKSTYSYEK